MKAGKQRDTRDKKRKKKTPKKIEESGCLKKSHTPADDVAKAPRMTPRKAAETGYGWSGGEEYVYQTRIAAV